MLIAATSEQGKAILGAMKRVATTDGRTPLSEAGHRSLLACARHGLGITDLPPVEALPGPSSEDLAATLSVTADPSRRLAAAAVRFLAVTALVDGSLDKPRIDLVLDCAAALGVQERYLEQLQAAVTGRLAWALADMTRQNIRSLWDQPWNEQDDVMVLLLPYRGERADPALVSRHEALGALPEDSFGRAWWTIYKDNGYAFPGDPRGANAAFVRPHDSTHVLSGYDTSPPGEILVSTFTAGMHPRLPMEGHILPVIFSWHLGIEINQFAGSAVGALDPAGFWEAWARGSEVAVDLFAPDWDFWSVVEEPVEHLRRRYRIPPRGAPPSARPANR